MAKLTNDNKSLLTGAIQEATKRALPRSHDGAEYLVKFVTETLKRMEIISPLAAATKTLRALGELLPANFTPAQQPVLALATSHRPGKGPTHGGAKFDHTNG